MQPAARLCIAHRAFEAAHDNYIVVDKLEEMHPNKMDHFQSLSPTNSWLFPAPLCALITACLCAPRERIPDMGCTYHRLPLPTRQARNPRPQALNFSTPPSLSLHQVNNKRQSTPPSPQLPPTNLRARSYPLPPPSPTVPPARRFVNPSLLNHHNCSRLPLPVYQDSKFPQPHYTVRLRVRQPQNFNHHVRPSRQCHRPDGHHLPRQRCSRCHHPSCGEHRRPAAHLRRG